MSLHGRIYVPKNLFLDKQKQKHMEAHYKSLNQIKEGSYIKQRYWDVTKSTDETMRLRHQIKQRAHEFNDACKLFLNLTLSRDEEEHHQGEQDPVFEAGRYSERKILNNRWPAHAFSQHR